MSFEKEYSECEKGKIVFRENYLRYRERQEKIKTSLYVQALGNLGRFINPGGKTTMLTVDSPINYPLKYIRD